MDRISCPSCGESYQIDATYQGRSFACHCGAVVAVPAAGGGAPPPPPPPPSSQQGYGYQGPASQSSTTALVLGILGVTLCGLCAPFAWSIGAKARREARAKGMEPDGTATGGWVLGIIGSIMLILAILWVVFVLLMAGGMAASTM